MVAFATSTDLANFLQVVISNAAAATDALAEAKAAIQNYTRQTIEQVVGDVATLTAPPGRSIVLLPEQPVTAVASVVEDGTTLVVSDDYTWSAEGLLGRVGRYWNSGFRKLVVTYTHGYTTIPDDVKFVAVRAAARRYQAGLRASAAAGVAGIQSQTIPDYSVAYTPESGPNSAMMLGASAAIILLPSEKALLDKYRMKP